MVKALATIKGYYDYGIFAPIQIASVIAMRECKRDARRAERRSTRSAATSSAAAWTSSAGPTKSRWRSMFVWAKINPAHFKAGEGTIDFCLRMMDEAEVALRPGRAFGENGEGLRAHRAGRERASTEAGDAESRSGAESETPQTEATPRGRGELNQASQQLRTMAAPFCAVELETQRDILGHGGTFQGITLQKPSGPHGLERPCHGPPWIDKSHAFLYDTCTYENLETDCGDRVCSGLKCRWRNCLRIFNPISVPTCRRCAFGRDIA